MLNKAEIIRKFNTQRNREIVNFWKTTVKEEEPLNLLTHITQLLKLEVKNVAEIEFIKFNQSL